jgi:hypothetical protein
VIKQTFYSRFLWTTIFKEKPNVFDSIIIDWTFNKLWCLSYYHLIFEILRFLLETKFINISTRNIRQLNWLKRRRNIVDEFLICKSKIFHKITFLFVSLFLHSFILQCRFFKQKQFLVNFHITHFYRNEKNYSYIHNIS